MSIVSVRQIERHVPFSCRNADNSPIPGSPVYLITPPSIMTKARWRRDLAEAGAILPTRDDLLETIRQGINTLVAEDQRPEFIALIEEWDALFRALQELRENGTGTPEEVEDAADQLRAISGRMEYLEGEMRGKYPPYSQKLGQQQYWMEIAPILAAKHFLCGWENLDIPFARENGLVPDDLLELVPPGHLADVGWRAIGLTAASRTDVKNSERASASGGSPKRSRRVSKVRGLSLAKN
jgi:hypothetical protein